MTGKVEPLKDLEERVYCSRCKGKTNHKIIKTYEEFSDSHSDLDWHVAYRIVKCSGCSNIAFVEQYGDYDTWEYIDGHREWVDIFKVYPEEPIEEIVDFEVKLFERHKIDTKNFKHAPENISNLYEQIIGSYNSQHLILCTSGLRTLIEGICSQLGIANGHLYDKERNIISDRDGEVRKKESLGGRIFGLYENDLILFPQALLLQKIKDIGNNAIHDIVVPEISSIKDIITIVERVMYDIYELKNHRLLQEDIK